MLDTLKKKGTNWLMSFLNFTCFLRIDLMSGKEVDFKLEHKKEIRGIALIAAELDIEPPSAIKTQAGTCAATVVESLGMTKSGAGFLENQTLRRHLGMLEMNWKKSFTCLRKTS